MIEKLVHKFASTYWLEVPLIIGEHKAPSNGGIVIIGSGLTGVSVAYWLLLYGYKNVTIIDYLPEQAASFRNAGHILHGTVESLSALSAIHSEALASQIWQFSVESCNKIKHTIVQEKLEVDYRHDGYLVIAIDKTELLELEDSITLLEKAGFKNDFIAKKKLEQLGFRHVLGARFDPYSAQAHPLKFRNQLLERCLERGLKYFSGIEVKNIEDKHGQGRIHYHHGIIECDAIVLATNAYSPLISDFFAKRRLIEPFRGQIIVSKPIKQNIPASMPHSFDHGYEYALKLEDNRLLIGGWRQHTAAKEIGSYDLHVNLDISAGLKAFVKKHYSFVEDIEWDYEWTGIMAASKTGLPFIGPTSSPIIFSCAGYTGHGFSWSHGSAELLAKIILGEKIDSQVAALFNPTRI